MCCEHVWIPTAVRTLCPDELMRRKRAVHATQSFKHTHTHAEVLCSNKHAAQYFKNPLKDRISHILLDTVCARVWMCVMRMGKSRGSDCIQIRLCNGALCCVWRHMYCMCMCTHIRLNETRASVYRGKANMSSFVYECLRMYM